MVWPTNSELEQRVPDRRFFFSQKLELVSVVRDIIGEIIMLKWLAFTLYLFQILNFAVCKNVFSLKLLGRKLALDGLFAF